MNTGLRDKAVRSFFFKRAGPRSPSGTMSYVDLQWPVLQMHFTCNGRLLLSKCTWSFLQAVATSAKLRQQALGRKSQAAVHIVFHKQTHNQKV